MEWRGDSTGTAVHYEGQHQLKRIRLAIVDDSSFIRKALSRLLAGEPRLQIVGTAASGEELLSNLELWKPDVVTLDLSMPGIGGLATLERILQWRRIPVIILSTHSSKDAPMTIEALHSGAVDFIDKQQYSLVDFQALRDVLLERIQSVVSGTPHGAARTETAPSPAADHGQPKDDMEVFPAGFDIVVIGASTGGPPAIQEILEDIGAPPPIPIMIVQHMPLGFTRAFADRLNAHLHMPVREAVHTEVSVPGTVYIAPSGAHVRLRVANGRISSVMTRYPENVQHRPSVDVLFESAVPLGGRVLAVLLTGMGKDGAEGLGQLRQAGALTIAQDEASSIVYGMPKAAVNLGAVQESVALSAMGDRIARLLGMRRR
jgi:two-component system chemotaxis response regulator CheB